MVSRCPRRVKSRLSCSQTSISYVPGSKLLILEMVIPPLIENPYINPYCKLDDHHLPQGANVSLDPGIVLGCHERASLIKSKIIQQKSHHGPLEMLRLLRIGCVGFAKNRLHWNDNFWNLYTSSFEVVLELMLKLVLWNLVSPPNPDPSQSFKLPTLHIEKYMDPNQSIYQCFKLILPGTPFWRMGEFLLPFPQRVFEITGFQGPRHTAVSHCLAVEPGVVKIKGEGTPPEANALPSQKKTESQKHSSTRFS